MGDNSGQYGNGTITATWSNGTLTATGTTVTRGGSVGDSAGTFSDVYWDTTTTGIADDADNNAPEGKTTSELQTPTEAQKSLPNYPSGLYANWNVPRPDTNAGRRGGQRQPLGLRSQ